MTSTTLLPFQPEAMTPAQLAAVSYLARYTGHTHTLYAYQLRRWFGWCETNALDPLVGVQRAHLELYIRHLGDSGLRVSSVNTMMHGVRGFFRFAHIDGLIGADPAVYARLPKIHSDESRTQGLDRLELIRFLQVAQTLTVHHGALAYLLGINALRASEAAAVRRGLPGNAPRPPGPAPDRQRHQARHHADNRPGAPRPGSLPRRTNQRTLGTAPRFGKADRPPRRLPDGLAGRKGRRHPSAYQSSIAAARCDHERTRCRCAAARRPDPGRHADPRTTEHYDRARGNLDRDGVHFLTAYVAASDLPPSHPG
ncbi:MAG TPA: site-specific integrase [Thermomicrobiales bacterium]|nr:site-specific integrase [Thermomicrobiales bacterium]